MEKQIEILAPAGSYESMKAAIAAGADAVYIGGMRFGARAFADNLTEEMLLEAIDYVHLHGRKIYLTINTLLKESEINQLYEYLLPYYKRGIDAVIVQDVGVLQYVKRHFPDLPIHASTQMTTTNVLGAKLLEQLGAERVVTAREMNIDEIRLIHEQTNLEIESFVHGALCYCYSGQCLYSSLIGGRSGNRGQCAQPCRLPYRLSGEEKNQYLMSLKDICTLENIPELIEAGIHSFKIEGRMKKPEYVALVTAMYRKYVDLYFEKGIQCFRVSDKDKEQLMDLYNRGGFHSGYYHVKNGREMLSLERPNHAGVPALKVIKCAGNVLTIRALTEINKGDIIELSDSRENYTFSDGMSKGEMTNIRLQKRSGVSSGTTLYRTRNEKLISEIGEQYLLPKVKEKIKGFLILSVGDVSRLKLQYRDVSVEVTGAYVDQALNQPMDIQRIEKQMRKTGNTEFEFEELIVELQGNVFVPMQSLNELRRNGIDTLTNAILAQFRRMKEAPQIKIDEQFVTSHNAQCNTFFAYVEEYEQFLTVADSGCVSRIYVDANVFQMPNTGGVKEVIAYGHARGIEVYFGMPHIFREQTVRIYERLYERLLYQEWDGILIRNLESYQFLIEHGYQGKIVTDYNLYQFNRWAKEFWQQMQVEATTAPLELNYKELKSVGLENSELVVYGYYPMMISAQCIQKTTKGCYAKYGRLSFVDRYQKKFVVKNHCDYCYNVIYNTAPVVLTDQVELIQGLAPKALRLHFTIEDEKEVKNILRLYADAFLYRRSASEPTIEFTRGHFKRGIK